jgi:hypothetical protein
MKKPSTAIKTSRQDIIEPSFNKKLNILVKAKDLLVSETAELAERMILFAASLTELEEEAKSLDKACKTKVHTEEFEKHLSVRALGLSPAIRSRWNTIASQAPALLKIHTSLPATRDALYETARALKQDENVSMWVKKQQLTPLSTVKEINDLRSKGKRTAPAKKAPTKFTASTTNKKWIPSKKSIPLGISIKDLPIDKPEQAFHNDLMLLVVKREVDPDTSKSRLVAVGVVNDPSMVLDQ